MAKRKSFEENLKDFVNKYEEENIIDEKLKGKILKDATSWNKDSIMVELIRRIDEFRLYEDEKEFPYQVYLVKFMQGSPSPKQVVEEDFS